MHEIEARMTDPEARYFGALLKRKPAADQRDPPRKDPLQRLAGSGLQGIGAPPAFTGYC